MKKLSHCQPVVANRFMRVHIVRAHYNGVLLQYLPPGPQYCAKSITEDGLGSSLTCLHEVCLFIVLYSGFHF